MKVLHLSTTDVEGGAARAAYRLHRGLLGCGVESRMLVQTKYGSDPLVSGAGTTIGRNAALLKYLADSLPVMLSRRRRGATFSPAGLPDRLAGKAAGMAPDLLHLHWTAGGFLRVETVGEFTAPVVWTLHDMWPFTGGCHYSAGCTRYTGSCGCCPQLDSSIEKDLSRRIWARKKRAWRQVPLTVIAPSRWMADCAKASSLFGTADIRVLPNGIDTTLFRPCSQTKARETLRLPQDKRLILFGAMDPTGDPRKGFQHLRHACRDLAGEGLAGSVELVVYGATPAGTPPDLGLKAHYLGRVTDDTTMALLYSAADVFVASSLEDNLPNTVMEALACGTPAVAFRVGGIVDLIEQGETGWLAEPFDHRELARGIVYLLEDALRRIAMGRRAREGVVRRFASEVVARRHLDLYQELLNRGRT